MDKLKQYVIGIRQLTLKIFPRIFCLTILLSKYHFESKKSSSKVRLWLWKQKKFKKINLIYFYFIFSEVWFLWVDYGSPPYTPRRSLPSQFLTPVSRGWETRCFGGRGDRPRVSAQVLTVPEPKLCLTELFLWGHGHSCGWTFYTCVEPTQQF